MRDWIEGLKNNPTIVCTKLIPFKENGRLYVRWEGEFTDKNTLLPMKLIIPKLCMDVINLETQRVNSRKIPSSHLGLTICPSEENPLSIISWHIALKVSSI